MVNAEKISKLGNESKGTSLSNIEKLEHPKPVDCSASHPYNKLYNNSNEKETMQNEIETQALDKPDNAIESEGNVGMEPNFQFSDINEWQTVSKSRKKKNKMHYINTNRQNHNLKFVVKGSKYNNINFSSNVEEKILKDREYKILSVKDKSQKMTLHDSSFGKVARLTNLENSTKIVRTDAVYEGSRELSIETKNEIAHHNLNKEFVENPSVETSVTRSVQHAKEFDLTSTKAIKQSKFSERKTAPMRHLYGEKSILNESLTERQFKNKSAFHRNSRTAQNYRKVVGAGESGPNELGVTKRVKQEKTNGIDSKSELCVMYKKMVNKSLAIDGTINEEQLNKHAKVIDLLKPVHYKVNDVKERNVAANLKNEETLSSQKTVEAHESEQNKLDLTESTLKKQEKIDRSLVSKSCVMNKTTVNESLGRDGTSNRKQLNEHADVIDLLKPVHNKVNDAINIKEHNQKVANFMNAENLSSIKTDAQDEYKHYESNQPLTKYLEIGQNRENTRYDWGNNAEANSIPVQHCDWDNNAEASNIPSQRCEWEKNAEASNIPSQRCEWDNNAETSIIPSQRCDWDNNTEESSVQSQRCDCDNAEASNSPSPRCDWDNAEASNSSSLRCDWDNAEASNSPSLRCDWDNAEENIKFQRCDWKNNSEASNIPFQQYNHINSENVYFLPNESVSIVPLNPENARCRFQPQFKGSLISGIPNQCFANEMTYSSIYSNQFQSFRNFDRQYYPEHAINEQGSGNSCAIQNNTNAIYNSVVSDMPARPFALSWTDGGVVYFQYYQNFAPVSYPCFVPVVGQNLLSHSSQFVPQFDLNSPYKTNLVDIVK